jgi:hypothetical protein
MIGPQMSGRMIYLCMLYEEAAANATNMTYPRGKAASSEHLPGAFSQFLVHG